MNCRLCGALVTKPFLDLGTAPPSNAFLPVAQLPAPETWFPLALFTCERCWLVQVDEVESHERLFAPDYVYFSSFSRSWLAHAEQFVARAADRLSLHSGSRVVEVASNDGYLLQYVAARGIPCYGIEPTRDTAAAARARGIETVEAFFGQRVAAQLRAERGAASLMIANNVLAHVPDVNDFVAGFATLLSDDGVATFEFPHLLELVRLRQFDTVYHEHFSYLSFTTVSSLLARHGLRAWDVERLPTHGGSLRVWTCRTRDARGDQPSVAALRHEEQASGMSEARFYEGFQQAAENVKNDFLEFLLQAKREKRRVAAYGAAAKGNTLLNFAGVKRDLLAFVVDASPHKQGRHLPGSRIPVVDESVLRRERPDLIVILPWNLRDEIAAQLEYARRWGARFATAVPRLEVF